MEDSMNDNVLVRQPGKYIPLTEDQIREVIKCADPATGYEYFMMNYFYIQHPIKGQMLYKPFPYQICLIKNMHSNRFCINLTGRQLGKTTSAAGYLLWYAMFNLDKTILIAAHQYSGAQEIMDRIRYAYEMCPIWLKPGVESYNKGNLDLENKSRIVARATTEKTGRGMSLSCVASETTEITVRDKETGKIKTVKISELIQENKGKKYFYNPAKPDEKILCQLADAPKGWINGIYKKSKV